MDLFSEDLPVDAFQQLPADHGPSDYQRVGRQAHRRRARLGGAPAPLRRRRRDVGSCDSGTRRARRGARSAGRAHVDGQRAVCTRTIRCSSASPGFWGTPISNEKCRTADLIVAVGTRLAEANSSSWDSRFTFSIPPTRLIHIDADEAEIGRNYPTELGVVADAKLALGGAGCRRPRDERIAIADVCGMRSPEVARHSRQTGITSGARNSFRCDRNGSWPSCARRFPRTASS